MSAAFVLIPQALAYAVLAGVPAERGLYVAALAPIAAAFFASSPYLGTGPTAITSLLAFGGLSAIARPMSLDYVELAALLAVMVGVIRIALGLMHGGFIAYLMSQPIVLGFVSAAGVVIVATQVPTVLGMPATDDNPFLAAFEALRDPGGWEAASVVISLATAAVIVAGKRIHLLFPGVLVAVGAAIAWSAATDYSGPVVGAVESGFPPFSLALPWGQMMSLVVPALVIATIGFSEPASIARSYATLERKRWDANRELISQGMANLAAGVGGGFPAGGSFSRSALVRSAGARTRLSGGVTGLVVLLLLPFISTVEHLPAAVLGASIIVAVVGMINVAEILDYRRIAKVQFGIAVATFVLTIALAPHVERAVVIAVVLAIVAHLWREMRLSIPAWTDNGTLHLQPHGVLYFMSAPSVEDAFLKLLSEHPRADSLVVHLDGLGRVDLTGALVIKRLLQEARAAGLEASVADVPPQAEKVIRRALED